MAAGNEWINGYLEAILDAGSRLRGQRQGQQGGAPPVTAALPRLLLAGAEAGGQGAGAAYSPTRYFVEEVVSRFDDRDLHKTWTKVRSIARAYGGELIGGRPPLHAPADRFLT